MKNVFKTLEELLKNIIPSEIKYVFKEKYETDQKYEFILVIEKKDFILFKDKKLNLIESITNICNSQASTFFKKK